MLLINMLHTSSDFLKLVASTIVGYGVIRVPNFGVTLVADCPPIVALRCSSLSGKQSSTGILQQM